MTTDHKTIDGRYRLGSPLGQGGMAEVRLGLDLKLCRPVAVKRLRDCLATDPEAQARFQDEARSVASLSHPNIVAIYDTGEDAGTATGVRVPYLVMELVTGRTLKSLLRDEHRLAPERALPLVQGVLAALAHSHAAGIVHQDVKPSNVMVTPDDEVKVMDFGIARRLTDAVAAPGPALVVLGTAKYLAPERARGLTADARSDLYSAGCLLYEVLVGAPPFTGDSPADIAACHLRDVPVPPSERVDGITAELDAVVLKALAKDPAARFSTAAEMSHALATVLAGRPAVPEVAPVVPLPAPVVALPVRPPVVVGSASRRRRTVAAAVAALMFPVAGMAGYDLLRPGTAEVQQAGAALALGATSGELNAAAAARPAPAPADAEGAVTAEKGSTSSRSEAVAPEKARRTLVSGDQAGTGTLGAGTLETGTADKPVVHPVSTTAASSAERTRTTTKAAAKPRPTGRTSGPASPTRTAAPKPARTEHRPAPAPRTTTPPKAPTPPPAPAAKPTRDRPEGKGRGGDDRSGSRADRPSRERTERGHGRGRGRSGGDDRRKDDRRNDDRRGRSDDRDRSSGHGSGGSDHDDRSGKHGGGKDHKDDKDN